MNGCMCKQIFFSLITVYISCLLLALADEPIQLCSSSKCSCLLHVPSVGKGLVTCNIVEDFDEYLSSIYSRSSHLNIATLNVSNSTQLVTNHLTELLKPFKDSLKKLTLSNNQLTSFPVLNLEEYPRLEHLDVSFNNISRVPILQSYSIKHLNLSHNYLETLAWRPFLIGLPGLQHLDISYNRFEGILKVASASTITYTLAGNPWHCGAALIWLLHDAQNLVVDREKAFCQTPLVVKSFNFMEVLPYVMAFETCKSCTCTVANEGIEVNCTDKNLSSLPADLPFGAAIVILDDNKIKFLSSISNYTNWSSVKYLHLRNNEVALLQDTERSGFLKGFRFLDLRQNRLELIPLHILEQMSHLDLWISENPWQCDCNTIAFQNWLHRNHDKIKDFELVRCRSGKSITRIGKSELCPQERDPVEYLDIISVILAVLTTSMILKLGYDWYWQKRTGKLPAFFRINH